MLMPVDREKCVGCGRCVLACPMDVIRMENGRAQAVYIQECMCCAACELECPAGALYVSPDKSEELFVSWK